MPTAARNASQAPRMRCKAAEARRLVPVVVSFLENLPGPLSRHDAIRLQCGESLLRIYQLMSNWDTMRGPELLLQSSRQHLQLNSWLASEAAAANKDCWRIIPKHHLFCHLCQMVSRDGNPTLWWCYSDESEIRLTAILAAGLHPTTMHRTIMMRYRFGIA